MHMFECVKWSDKEKTYYFESFKDLRDYVKSIYGYGVVVKSKGSIVVSNENTKELIENLRTDSLKVRKHSARWLEKTSAKKYLKHHSNFFEMQNKRGIVWELDITNLKGSENE